MGFAARLCGRSLLVVGATVLALYSRPELQARETGAAVLGKWKLTTLLDSSDITSIDEKAARHLVGHMLIIRRNKVQFDERECAAPDFETERVEPALYLREQAHASAAKLGLPNPVTVVGVSCTVVFVKSSNRLVVHWKGYFFDAVRVSH